MPGAVVSKDAHHGFYAKHQGATGGRRPEGRIMGPVEGVRAYRSRTPEERRLVYGVNDWERGSGMRYHRTAMADPEALTVRLRARKLKAHQSLHQAVENAPKSDRPLYRGIMLHPDEAQAIAIGQKFNRGKESWTDQEHKAAKFAREQRLRHPSMYSKTQATVIESHTGSKAMNIQGVARYDMAEWLASHPYTVTDKTHENGVVRVKVAQNRKFMGNQHVDARGQRRQVRKAFEVDFLEMPGAMTKPDTREESLTAIRTRDLRTGRFVGAPTLVAKSTSSALGTAA